MRHPLGVPNLPIILYKKSACPPVCSTGKQQQQQQQHNIQHTSQIAAYCLNQDIFDKFASKFANGGYLRMAIITKRVDIQPGLRASQPGLRASQPGLRASQPGL